MKFRKTSIALASMLCFAALVGCSGSEKEQARTISKMKINGIVTAYMENQTIEWNKLSVTATYSDKATVTFANSEIEFDVETPASESSKLVVYTSGLHAQTSTLTEGEYSISAALVGSLDTKYSLGTIVVGKITPSKYKLRTYNKPTFVATYEQNIANAGSADEGRFKKADEVFTVGTLNAFKFAPIATFQSLEDPAKIIASDNYTKVVSLKIVNGETKTDAPANYWSQVKGGIQFAEAAAGQKYELVMSPADFDEKADGTAPFVAFTFKVEKGLNVYSAKELGALNLTHYTEADFYAEDKCFENHIGVLGNLTRYNSVSNIFWDSETGYYCPHYKTIWEDYLTATGTFNAEELVKYQDVPAIFLQSDIAVKSEDIPSSYFIADGEPGNIDNKRTGCLRDDVSIYLPIVHDNDVVVNGNYFMLDASDIKLCCSTTSVPGVDFYIFPDGYTGQVPPGHSALFQFCGIDPVNEDTYFQSQVDTANGHKGIVKNINSNGNTSVVDVQQNDKIMEVTGLIFSKNSECGSEYTNNIIKQYMIAFDSENTVGQKYGTHEQVNRSFVRDCKVFDCSNAGVFNYHHGGVLVEDSEFNRFGGSAVFNTGCEEQERAGILTVGKNVQMKNEITGQEVYFTAVGAADFFGIIKGWEPFFNAVGNSFVSDNKMDLIALNMDGEYVGSKLHSYYSDLYINKYDGSESELHGQIDPTYAAPEWQLYEGIHSMKGDYAPVFKTEKGEIFFTDNENALFYLDGAEVKPYPAQIQGEYMSVLLPAGSTTLNAIIRLNKLS